MTGPCPTPDKAQFGDAHAAQVEAIRIRADRRGPTLSVYLCVCGFHHLTGPKSLDRRIQYALAGGGRRRRKGRR